MSKYCSSCKKTKPLEDFHKAASTHDGLQYACKVCRSAKQRVAYAAKKNKGLVRRVHKGIVVDWTLGEWARFCAIRQNKIAEVDRYLASRTFGRMSNG